ncbi:hypothetical protein [Pedobacter sp. MC2016-24]|uniref:hypothetical protein n=1 Tax=Pedobacter sp. MC2016-24 TaxID=2780090 RepID=UPI00187EBBB1|nr:hypothetical protein [Pedobacter sp. MC2016-24]MBE9601361.1 hypothetical protein [Pedobacter sp. MC2016-24]
MKEAKIIQQTWIPVALIAGNIALSHFIYLLAKGDYNYHLWATVICIIAITTGILRANKYLLIGGTGFYSIVLLVAICL